MENECELCKLELIHTGYDYWYVTFSEEFQVPMIVLKRHDMDPTMGEIFESFRIMKDKFPGLVMTCLTKEVPTHLHFHFVEKETQ